MLIPTCIIVEATGKSMHPTRCFVSDADSAQDGSESDHESRLETTPHEHDVVDPINPSRLSFEDRYGHGEGLSRLSGPSPEEPREEFAQFAAVRQSEHCVETRRLYESCHERMKGTSADNVLC